MIWQEFVGPAYSAPSRFQDDQQSFNLYTEPDPTPGAKAPLAQYSVPGKVTRVQLNLAEVRGLRSMPGYQKLLAVCGSNVWFVTPTGVATKLGEIGTTSGRVHIRDNNAQAEIIDNLSTYTVDIATGAFSSNTAANALFAPGTVEFLDGFLLFSDIGTRLFYITDVNDVTFTLPFFASKEGDSDLLIGLATYSRDLWVFGERTTEIWYNVDSTTLPFARMDGAFLQVGCVSKDSIANFDQGIVWLARNERGQGMVMRTAGFQLERVSNSAVEAAIQSYTTITDAIGDVYQHRGHEFYVLTFPTEKQTWVYDTMTNDWHRRGMFDPASGNLGRERANCFVNFAGEIWCGDLANGQIYALSDKVYVDGPTPLARVRRAPHIQDDHNRVFYERLQIEFAPGVGNTTTINPTAMLRWSDDGGQTFGNWHTRSIGKIGQYKHRTFWNRLGTARDRVFEVMVTDPVETTIINASLFVQPSAH